MAERAGLHRLAFELPIRFIRQADDEGCWGECCVCGDAIFGPSAEALEGALEKHRALIHVVMVYPYGMPKPAPRLRRARGETPAAAAVAR